MSIESPKIISNKKEDRNEFDFTDKEVLETLKSAEGKPLEFVGTATSDFQQDVIEHLALSDWGLEVSKKMTGQPSRLPERAVDGPMPQFSKNKEDYIKRSAELEQNMLRISFDFARLCPSENEFNEPLMAEYVKTLALAKVHGQEPFVALQHYTMPKYLLEIDAAGDVTKGAWENKDVAKHFQFYIENVLRFLGNEDKVRGTLAEAKFDKDTQDKFLAEGLVKYFMTINEPVMALLNGYMVGVFPPYKRGKIIAAKRVFDRLIEAHDIAFSEIKGGSLKKQETQVGIGYNWQNFDGILGKLAHEFDEYYTGKFERDGAHSDFLGLQYYFRMTMPLLSGKGKRDWSDHPGFGDIYPPGILEVLKKMHSAYPQKEIFITEFGFADKKDLRRPYWILETVRYVIEALKAGIPIKGMLLWTLVNNFEWDQGMEQKFGLFDEADLKKELQTSPAGEIRSWEAWRAAAKAITDPSEESLQQLQDYYQKAKRQYELALQSARK